MEISGVVVKRFERPTKDGKMKWGVNLDSMDSDDWISAFGSLPKDLLDGDWIKAVYSENGSYKNMVTWSHGEAPLSNDGPSRMKTQEYIIKQSCLKAAIERNGKDGTPDSDVDVARVYYNKILEEW